MDKDLIRHSLEARFICVHLRSSAVWQLAVCSDLPVPCTSVCTMPSKQCPRNMDCMAHGLSCAINCHCLAQTRKNQRCLMSVDGRSGLFGSSTCEAALPLATNNRMTVNQGRYRRFWLQIRVGQPAVIFHGTVRTAFGECE